MITLVNAPGFALSVKFRGWCLWHHSDESGLRAVQVGCVVVELW